MHIYIHTYIHTYKYVICLFVCSCSVLLYVPVIHMCRDESANGLQGLYLDAFLPVNRRAVCNCSLRASVNLLVGMNSVVLPEKNCNSELFIKPIHRIAVYTCNSGGTSSSEQRTIEKEWRMYLTANPTDKNVTYCINLYIASGSGIAIVYTHARACVRVCVCVCVCVIFIYNLSQYINIHLLPPCLCMYVCISVYMYGCMDVWMDVCMCVCECMCVYVCAYVCI